MFWVSVRVVVVFGVKVVVGVKVKIEVRVGSASI